MTVPVKANLIWPKLCSYRYFKGADIPESVQPIMTRLREDLTKLPDTELGVRTRPPAERLVGAMGLHDKV